MKTISVSELNSATEEFKPEAVRAKVEKVFDAKEGEGARGPWKLQAAVISQGGEEMRVVFSGRQTYLPDDIVGTEIYARAKRTKSGTFSGLQLKLDEYQGKPKKELFIYDNAEVSFGDEEAGEAILDFPKSNSEGANDNAQNVVTSTEQSVALSSDEEDSVLSAKKAITKSANLMLVCMDAARWVCQKYEEKHGENVTAEQFQAISSTMFINADKRGLVPTMPEKPLE